jgi:hypothetical protein
VAEWECRFLACLVEQRVTVIIGELVEERQLGLVCSTALRNCGMYTSRSVRSSISTLFLNRAVSTLFSAKCLAQPITLWRCTASRIAAPISPVTHGSSP